MDTRDKYIKMCEQTLEIQETWQPQDFDVVMGDYVSIIREWKHGKAALKPLFTTAGKWAWYDKKELIWLPRQDQLQALMDFDVWYDAITMLYHWDVSVQRNGEKDGSGSM